MVKITIRKTSVQNRSQARKINRSFNSSSNRRIIYSGMKQGSSVRSIQRVLSDDGSKIPQRDIYQYIRRNYADRTFNRWFEKVANNNTVSSFSGLGNFSRDANGVHVKGFVDAFEMNTGTKVFHKVDIIVPRNTSISKALQLVRERGLESLSNSLEVRIERTGFIT